VLAVARGKIAESQSLMSLAIAAQTIDPLHAVGPSVRNQPLDGAKIRVKDSTVSHSPIDFNCI